MTVTLIDSTTPASIPADAPAVAGYIDGRYAWTQVEWNRFTGTKVTITVTGSLAAQVCDCETGDLTPAQAVAWSQAKLDRGETPTVYRSLDNSFAVPAGTQLWLADWTGSPHLVRGSVATQYASNQAGQTGGINVDLSMTDGLWPGTLALVTMPATVAVIAVPGSDDSYWIVGSDGGVFTKGPAAQFYGSLGGKILSAPIVDASAVATPNGYRLVGADGAIYDFGSAIYEGGTNA